MANKADIDYSYTTIDKIFRLSMGEMGDFSGAKYDGDFSISLEEAQKRKHQYMLDSLAVKNGDRVMDMGCGWGSFLAFAQAQSIDGVGLTLSDGQHKSCLNNGLNVHIKDCRTVLPSDYGKFDGLVSVGAFEHFSSIQDYSDGNQKHVYHKFFEKAHDLLEDGGRFYLQSMVFGKNMIGLNGIDINAPKDSTAYILALMVKQFPGSWLPYGKEMIEEAAKPYFRLLSHSSGRLDYIETISQWRKKFRQFNLEKYWLYLTLLPKIFTDEDFKNRIAVFRISPNRICFEKEIMDHFRLVFEKV